MVKRTQIYLGTELKLNISVEPVDGLTMDDYDFNVDVYCTPKKTVHAEKDKCVRVDDSNYIVLVDTNIVGTGDLTCKVTAYIPDGDFPDSLRTEVVCTDVGLKVVKAS